MSNLIQMQRGAKSYATRKLFSEATFAINEGEHVGVIGPNGAGKTTMFRILTGKETLDSGEFVRTTNLRVGYLAQHDEWREGDTVEDFLERDTTLPIWEIKSLGRGLGLDDSIYARPIMSLSGGYRMRCKLLRLIGQEPDILLLDEPTNYLDLESTLALESFLQDYRGAFLLISHDREFLRRTTDHILEIEAGEVTKYNGSLDDYFEQKELLRTQLEAKAMSVEEKRKSILDFVARFGAKATKARQAQSRLKSLERLEKVELKALPNSAKIRMPEPVRTGKLILSLKSVELGYGSRTILKGLDFDLLRGDHLAVVGVNGAGKSTFLKSVAGRLDPLRGEFKLGLDVKIGYFAQHVSEALDPKLTVLEAIGQRAHSSVSSQDVLNLAGSLLFSGDDVKKRVSVLSGGEKSRVALGQILLEKSPCLVLDEPTNHLDFSTVEALTQALVEYAGTVVVVSHDRGFIGRIGSKILEIRDGGAHLYPGTYDDYVWSQQKGVLAARGTPYVEPVAPTATPVVDPAAGSYHERKRALDKDLRRVEKSLAQAETTVQSLQTRITDLSAKLEAEPASKLARDWARELAELQRNLDETEEKWLDHAAEREAISGQLAKLTG